MRRIGGLDIAGVKIGWASGPSDQIPRAGCLVLGPLDDDLGLRGLKFRLFLRNWITRQELEVVNFERPILKRMSDRVLTLRAIYGLCMEAETTCRELGVIYEEASAEALKRQLAGMAKADKDDMVAAALKLGVTTLPATKTAGRHDAADGVAAWLVAVRKYDPPSSAVWDRKLWSSRHALL